MEVKEIPIDQIEPNPWNPNRMSKREFEALKQEIQKRGQIYPIIVRELEDGKYQIIDGEHRWKAMKELGYKTIKVINLGKIDEKLAKILTINLNQIRGEFEDLEFAELLKSLLQEMSIQNLANEIYLTEEDIQGYLSLITEEERIETITSKQRQKSYKITMKFKTKDEYLKVVDFLHQYGKTPEEAIMNIIDILSTKK